MSCGRFLVYFMPMVCLCTPSEPPPSQEAVQQAWHRTDEAVQQSMSAHDEVKHIARLRDIDRMKYETDTADLGSQIDTLRGLCIGLLMISLVLICWLAIEVRRRRILSGLLYCQVSRPPVIPASDDRNSAPTTEPSQIS